MKLFLKLLIKGGIAIYLRLKQKRKNLQKEIYELTKKIQDLPEGKVLCVQNGKYTKWYRSNGTKPIYIPKAEIETIRQLALKKYYEIQKSKYQKELKLVTRYLSFLEAIYDDPEQILYQNSPFQSFLKPYLHNSLLEYEDWIHHDYQHSKSHPEKLIHRTLAGHYVRSKSEAIIANTLFANKIPYRYECGLQIGDITFFPDFTLMHPKTRKILYWEHFGMMELPDYAKQAFHKLGKYSAYGIIPTIHMIITFETMEEPIDSVRVQHLIDEYFGQF